jgi:tartrate dehydrogenase/decarboxylase/D-malate dehydrogenase
VGREFPGVELESVLVDALAARMVRDPGSLDVVVASNLFGDILTDLGAALQGSLGVAASANVAPGSGVPGIFEPVHGSAPDIAGRGLANPVGAVWSASLLLDHAGHAEAGDRLRAAIARTLQAGLLTRDLGGTASTREVGQAIVDAL